MTENQNNPSAKIKRHLKKYKNYYFSGAMVLLIIGVSRRMRGACPITGAPLADKTVLHTLDSTLTATLDLRGDFDSSEAVSFIHLVEDLAHELVSSDDPQYKLGNVGSEFSWGIKKFKIAEHLPELVSTVASATEAE